VLLKKSGTKVEHHGIKIEFIGQIGEYNDSVVNHRISITGSIFCSLARSCRLRN